MRTTITKEEATRKIYHTNGRIFGVEFIKRSNGELRKMAARKGVTKGVKGEGLQFDPKKKGLIPVYDMNNGFRFINIAGLQRVQIDGQEYSIKEV